MSPCRWDSIVAYGASNIGAAIQTARGASEDCSFYVVDDELYRFLPDGCRRNSRQSSDHSDAAIHAGSCRGLPGASVRSKIIGFVYAPRSKKPSGCLVPECIGKREPLAQASDLFPPTLRLQDELHLLKDSLGAVDAHYEALFDHLQHEITGTRAKILGSSATLTGYKKQVEVLYAREGARVSGCRT